MNNELERSTSDLHADFELNRTSVQANYAPDHIAHQLINAPKPVSIRVVEHPSGAREISVQGTDACISEAFACISQAGRQGQQKGEVEKLIAIALVSLAFTAITTGIVVKLTPQPQSSNATIQTRY